METSHHLSHENKAMSTAINLCPFCHVLCLFCHVLCYVMNKADMCGTSVCYVSHEPIFVLVFIGTKWTKMAAMLGAQKKKEKKCICCILIVKFVNANKYLHSFYISGSD